ncbi:MFS transporter [Arthrobacter sp. SW1]|uniref:MFS transporter n=1 Tax=Arthrobacter sp. SW1 TaxID=1920889 RepID=UPI000877E16F|nr:MFS transporter [Arthrobacter sp. SW1]OFI37113.1 MFS transporter [Arthrobacter sp. SW1]
MNSSPLSPPAPVEDRNRTFRRVILRLIPFLTLVWFLAWIDRVNIGFAKLTMMDSLQWSEVVYGAGAGIFFFGYFFFEVPSNLLLQKIGAPKTIMRIALGWGVVSVLMAFVQEEWQFYTLRFLLGAFEAGLQPGVILFLTYWLPAHRRGKAMAVFMSASAMSLMIGSPLAGSIMNAFDGSLAMHGWQWLFIVEGIPSIIVGILALFILTDRPGNAKWLSADEKEHIRYELASEQSTLGHRDHNFWVSLRKPITWVLILTFFCIVAGNATLTFYGPSLVKAVGITDIATLGWVMSAVYACGWLGMVGNGWLSDRNRESRWHTATAAALGALGLVLASVFLNQGSTLGVVLSLALSAAGTMGAIPVFWNLPARFMSGTALVAGLAVINSIANLAGYFAPQLLGGLKESTGAYNSGLYLIAAVEFLAVGFILIFIRKQAKQEQASEEGELESAGEPR